MTYFRDADDLQETFGRFFSRLSQRPDIADRLVAGSFVLRFRYKAPEAMVTIDLREAPIR